MSLRTKLTLGLGFLFLIIFALAAYDSFSIQQLSGEADRILKDNYDSLVFCKNMLVALDDMRTAASATVPGANPSKSFDYYSQLFQDSKSAFEKNLAAEKNNITENHERDYVAELDGAYNRYLSLSVQMEKIGGSTSTYFNDFVPTYLNARQKILQIDDLNMQAIERKNMAAHKDAGVMTVSIAALGALCVLLAFFYFWYFPFYVSNTLNYLATKAKELLKMIDVKVEMHSKDEALILLQSINLLENRLSRGDTKN
ncbi:MAG TPA: hypothetical protein VL354_11570 [Spirochaetia bacterium]|nr:hypothetical protein [Spirochaetia bacterium]